MRNESTGESTSNTGSSSTRRNESNQLDLIPPSSLSNPQPQPYPPLFSSLSHHLRQHEPLRSLQCLTNLPLLPFLPAPSSLEDRKQQTEESGFEGRADDGREGGGREGLREEEGRVGGEGRKKERGRTERVSRRVVREQERDERRNAPQGTQKPPPVDR